MQDIDVRDLLQNFLAECGACRDYFHENVALLLNDDEVLSDKQVESILVILNEHHAGH